MMRWLLWKFGYLKVDYGFSCGRHWIKIDGKTIAQTPGDDVWLRDEEIKLFGRAVIPGCAEKHWRTSAEIAMTPNGREADGR